MGSDALFRGLRFQSLGLLVATSLAPAALWLLGALLLPGALLLLGILLIPEATAAQETGSLAETLNRQFIGEIQVGGSVLDASTGEPLARVRFSADARLFEDGKMEMRLIDRHKEEVTGAFRYQCAPCSQLRVRLSKSGYRSETLSFAVAEGVAVDETRLQVRLQPLEQPVRLYRMDGEVIAAPNDKARALSLDLKNYQSRPLGLDHLPAKSELGSGLFLFSLDVETGDDGKAMTHRIVEKKAAGSSMASVHPRPTVAWLEISEGAGVQLYQPEDPRPRPALRSMNKAPTDGYSDRLPVGSTAEKVYFFLRVGERYGKGYVDAPWIDNQGDVRARVRMWLNDGGQSLEAAYE